ncbi:GNAT family N-acetyltransferase [Kineococcus esterisolvens]|uniref:GNAT family N-acetyltransferase n=1 Tax=unclassified Kineococcus TaxID=2621656 RepID=UPI003D7EB546
MSAAPEGSRRAAAELRLATAVVRSRVERARERRRALVAARWADVVARADRGPDELQIEIDHAAEHVPAEGTAAGPVVVRDDPAEHRYEAHVDGELAAIAEYLPTQQFLVFSHTEVLPGHEGRGVGSALVRGALDDVRRRGLRVVPLCPFVAAWIRRHAEDYADLVFTSPPRTSPGTGRQAASPLPGTP